MAEKVRIEDFGQKIGGARKDMYTRKGGMTVDDLVDMTEEEKKKFVIKQNIWIKPDYEKMKLDGISPEKILFVKQVYDALPKGNPDYHRYNEFIPFIQAFRDKTMTIRDMSTEDFIAALKNRSFFREPMQTLGARIYDGNSCY